MITILNEAIKVISNALEYPLCVLGSALNLFVPVLDSLKHEIDFSDRVLISRHNDFLSSLGRELCEYLRFQAPDHEPFL